MGPSAWLGEPGKRCKRMAISWPPTPERQRLGRTTCEVPLFGCRSGGAAASHAPRPASDSRLLVLQSFRPDPNPLPQPGALNARCRGNALHHARPALHQHPSDAGDGRRTAGHRDRFVLSCGRDRGMPIANNPSCDRERLPNASCAFAAGHSPAGRFISQAVHRALRAHKRQSGFLKNVRARQPRARDVSKKCPTQQQEKTSDRGGYRLRSKSSTTSSSSVTSHQGFTSYMPS